jgi:Xaa-Pro aminopeptidase
MTDAAPTISLERFEARLAACRLAVAERGLASLLLSVGPDLRYLTGFVGEPMERFTLLVVPREGPVSFLVPRLEAQKAAETRLVAAGSARVVPFDESDDAAALVADMLRSHAAAPIGVSDRMWSMHLLRLEAALPGRRFESASVVMGNCARSRTQTRLACWRLPLKPPTARSTACPQVRWQTEPRRT